ncbi:MAG TPA: ergothioneine biosynthesis protein EgtB [Segetibacter sp.]|jgi:ergothioneine biosynthesis protein EgtB
MTISERYKTVRQRTEAICEPLETEDFVVQPIADVSPPKWHIGHTTWFFETFILKNNIAGYQEFNPDYNYVFNSYYETVGARVIRTDRGNLSRPTVKDIFRYRKYVDEAMGQLLESGYDPQLNKLLELGFNHEEQHQELLLTDIKYILGNNPLFPVYKNEAATEANAGTEANFITIEEGIYKIGFSGNAFSFDNELGRHKVYLSKFKIATGLVTNGAFMEFINAGGYTDFKHWHAEGLDWVRKNNIDSPMYWHKINNQWHHYTFNGLQPVDANGILNHISFYEASAYASWKGLRLPTEFEWEAAANKFNWGSRWEWTESAYLPYPGFAKAPGAIGEYNGKFMVNQKVLRGASEVTSPGHSRITYRNFFHPHLRWQYTGIRLAQ